MMNRPFPHALIVLLLGAALPQCQQLAIQTESGKQTVLTRSDTDSLPHVKVTTPGFETPRTFVEVALRAVFEKAGVEFGHSMRGKRLASRVEASDGYRAAIALPELDADFTDKEVVLAYLQDGKPLDDKAGPSRIVIPEEKRMARRARTGHQTQDRGCAVGFSALNHYPMALTTANTVSPSFGFNSSAL